jgi:hypothetical protein
VIARGTKDPKGQPKKRGRPTIRADGRALSSTERKERYRERVRQAWEQYLWEAYKRRVVRGVKLTGPRGDKLRAQADKLVLDMAAVVAFFNEGRSHEMDRLSIDDIREALDRRFGLRYSRDSALCHCGRDMRDVLRAGPGVTVWKLD